MAARFWVTGGTGDWNSTTNWSLLSGSLSGASVPGSGDTAAFDANSGSGTVTLDISPDIQTLTMTGFTGTLAFGTNTISLNSTGTIFTGATTMAVSGTPLIICTNSSATARVITPSIVTEANSISFRITAGTGTFSISSGNTVKDLDFTDGVNPTGFSGALGTGLNTIYGNFKASTGMTQLVTASAITFAATSGTKTIDTAGVTFDRPFTFNGVGGTFQLASALTSGATRTTTLTNGTLNLNNFTLTTGLFATNASNATTLAFGTGNITLSGTGTIFTGSTTCTVTGTPQVICTDSSATSRTISPTAVTEANSISFRITAGTGTFSLTTTHAVRNLDFTDGTNPTGYGGAFTGSTTNTVYGNFKASTNMSGASGSGVLTFAATSGTKTIDTAGVTFDRPFTFNGVGGTWQLQAALTSGSTRACTLTNGTLDLASYTLTTGLFSSNNSNTRVLAFGTGKIVLTGTNASVYSTATATGLTLTGSRTVEVTAVGTVGQQRNLNGGSTSAGGSAANAANFYIKAGADTISIGTISRAIGTVDFTGFSGSTLADTTPVIYGDLVLSTGMTVTAGTGVWTFAATTSQTITTNGKTLDFPVTFNGIGGTWEMQDALSVTGTLTLTNGTLKLKSGTTSTVGAFATSGTNPKYLYATTFGSQATISDASGTNTVDYLTIQDSNATGGAIFDALAITNVDAGNNTGWLFSTTPSIGNEITMRLRSFTQPRRF